MRKKKYKKNPSNYYLWKVKKFHGDNVTNESAKEKKTTGGAPNAPHPVVFLGLTLWEIYQALCVGNDSDP